MISEVQYPSPVMNNGVFHQITEMGHEQVMHCYDESTGLKAIIAIHNTTLGPSLGGTRFWNYNTEEEALRDVLRLSRGMTFKSSISGINLGGGKAVIIGDPKKLKSEAFWKRYGQFVESLGGKYITAEDVNTSPEDIAIIGTQTKHVAGLPGIGGDPSPVTAYGVYLGIKASCKERFGSDQVAGKTIVVQGCGHVGSYLIDLLIKDGAIVKISDISEEKINAILQKHPLEVVAPSDIYNTDMDIYAPCALGATINPKNLEALKCSIIAGAANNQLEDEERDGNILREKGILWAPDFLINAGGVINCYVELDGYDKNKAMLLCEKIYDRTLEIFAEAKANQITTSEAAIAIAQKRIDLAKAK